MQRSTLSKLTAALMITSAGSVAMMSQSASAVPITGFYTDDARCDLLPNQGLTHELGDAAIFPVNEGIIYQAQQVNFTVCVPDDGLPNDWVVRMINTTGIAWQDLYFVCDLGATVGNADGSMEDVIGAPLVFTDAFRIDGTVTLGLNNNLLSESINSNEIFEPGEIWDFAVSNFNTFPGAVFPPIFQTPGIFSGSSPLNAANPSNASILANPVPEPGTMGVVMLVAGALLLRRRRS